MRKISFFLLFLLIFVGLLQFNPVYAADGACTTPTRLNGLVSLQDGTPVKDSVILVYSGNKSFGNVYNVPDGHYIFIFPIEVMASGKASGRVVATYRDNSGESAFEISCGDSKEVNVILGVVKKELPENQTNQQQNNPSQPSGLNPPNQPSGLNPSSQPGGENPNNPNTPNNSGNSNPTNPSQPSGLNNNQPSGSNPSKPGGAVNQNQTTKNSNKSTNSTQAVSSDNFNNSGQDSMFTTYILLAVLVFVVAISFYIIKKKGEKN